MNNTSENLNFKDLSQHRVNDAAKVINSDEIHILVDMYGYSGYIKNSVIKIFALRPAPIQVSWLNNPCTSNATFIDYFFRFDSYSSINPPNEYNGKVFSLRSTIFPGNHMLRYKHLIKRKVKENTFNMLDKKNLCLTSISDFDNQVNMNFNNMYCQEDPLKEYMRAFYNLPENAIVFCNFSKLYKIDPFTFRMWLTILDKVPSSVLWLLYLNGAAEENLKKFANDLKIDSSRIIFSECIDKHKHLNRIQLADVYLDSCLYNGHMACLDALWAGVPVVTLRGKTFLSCVTASQLSALGFVDTIAKNEENYIKIAIQLGMNKQLLKDTKNRIWGSKEYCKLFDVNSYTKEFMDYLINARKIK